MPKPNRINAMIDVIKKVSDEDYSVRMESSKGNDEIDRLANEINLLINQLGKKSTGDQLKEVEEENYSILKASIESIQDGVLVVLGKSKVYDYNARFCQMWWIPNTVMASGDDRILIDFVLPKLIDSNFFISVINDLYESSEASEDVLYLKDGRVFERCSYPLVQGNKVRGRVWLFRDITERKELETALRMTQFSYDRAPIGIFRIDKDAMIMDVNEYTSGYSGYTRDELCQMTIMELNPTVDPERWQYFWDRMLELGANSFETVHQRKDGTTVPVEITANHLVFEGNEFAIAFVQDITERKKSLGELHLARHCIEKASVGIFRIDEKGNIMSVNEKAAQILGYTQEKLCNLTIFEIDPTFPREKWQAHRDSLHRTGTKSLESIHQRKDGTTFPVEVLINLHNFEGEEFALSFVNDITLRKKAEKEYETLQKELIHSQKMEAIGQLAGGIAHDFNNLLQTILGNSELLHLEWDEQMPGYDRLKQIQRASLRANELTRQLLTYSRKIESHLQSTSLNTEVKNVVDLLKRTMPKMISIELFLEDNLYTVNADPLQIEQIVMNLSINAQHAMPEGGKLIFETRNISLDRECCRTHLGALPGNYAVLYISDSGVGMDRATMDQIYNPFYTTKEVGQGSGLGLSMVYGIIKNHGAYISCYSEVGQGTTFKIYFPALDVDHKHSAIEAPVMEMLGGTETILVVDDDRSIVTLTEEMLGRYGYQTVTALTGEAALRMYESERDRIDLIILDLNMPGMGGGACLKELIKLDPDLKVLISSGYSPNGNVRRTLESGVGGFIGKPFQIYELLKVIRDLLDAE